MEEFDINDLIGNDSFLVNPDDAIKGYKGSLSVKIVIPSYCQANCPFCFNHETINSQKHDYEKFLNNLSNSLDMICDNVTTRPVSLNITGNEPTYDIKLFESVMNILKKYKDKVKRIILTSNGYHLSECISSMIDVVSIVNISVHDYDYENRKKIFNTSKIPNDYELKNTINRLKENNITCSSVAVLYKNLDFSEFYDKFTKWSIKLGFYDCRMRSNFCANDKFIEDIINMKMENSTLDTLNALTTKRIVDPKTHFVTSIIKGVPDLTKYVIGAELVIDDDGFTYIDYNKRYPIDVNNINYLNNIYILGKEDLSGVKVKKIN